MNLIEALKSGYSFKRENWTFFHSIGSLSDKYKLDAASLAEQFFIILPDHDFFSIEDILADDWEIDEEGHHNE